MSVSNYRVNIETRGYVHIGTGNKLSKKDYFQHDNFKGKVLVLDQAKFIKNLNDQERAKYCEFLEDSQTKDTLTAYLKEKHLTNKALTCKSYTLDTDLSRNTQGRPLNYDISEFIKDSKNRPYVPGSSVKGMLRTALLAALIAADPDKDKYQQYYKLKKDKNAKKGLDDQLEKGIFNKIGDGDKQENAVNDIMRFIAVADSEPLRTTDLCLVKKYDKFPQNHKRVSGDDKKGNQLNIYRECLKSGTKIELKIAIDDRINQYLPFTLNKAGLEKIFKDFQQRYYECFLKSFDLREVNLPQTANAICYLGGGVDFVSKTVLHYLFAEPIEKIARELYDQFPTQLDPFNPIVKRIKDAGFPEPASFRRGGKQKKQDHRHWLDPKFAVAPHTLKLGKNGSKTLPMGECSIQFSLLN